MTTKDLYNFQIKNTNDASETRTGYVKRSKIRNNYSLFNIMQIRQIPATPKFIKREKNPVPFLKITKIIKKEIQKNQFYYLRIKFKTQRGKYDSKMIGNKIDIFNLYSKFDIIFF